MRRTAKKAAISALLISLTAFAQETGKSESKEAKIARALSAAPESVSKDAKVVDRDENGAETGQADKHRAGHRIHAAGRYRLERDRPKRNFRARDQGTGSLDDHVAL